MSGINRDKKRKEKSKKVRDVLDFVIEKKKRGQWKKIKEKLNLKKLTFKHYIVIILGNKD